MKLYEFRDYKQVLKEQVRKQKQKDPQTNLRWLAEEVRVQYTFLSRALNNDDIHLSETHLFKICRLLKFTLAEIEFILLLRLVSISDDESLREFHLAKVHLISERNKVDAKTKTFNPENAQLEAEYLLDPYVVVIHAALFIPAIAKRPQLLIAPLGLSEGQLYDRLRILENSGFIKLSKSGKTIEDILETKLHFSADHPLIRPHQQILRNLCLAQMMKLREPSKTSFMATFSGSDELFQEVNSEFKIFLSKVQTLSQQGPDEKVYQFNFDFFSWL